MAGTRLKFAWTNEYGIKAAVDYGTPDPLTRDGVVGRTAAFWVDLPDGTYDVTATLGDAAQPRDRMQIWVEPQGIVATVTTMAGQFARPTFQATVTNGLLVLVFLGGSGAHPDFTLDALEIHPAAPAADAGPDLTAEEGRTITFQGRASGGTNLSSTWDFGDGTAAAGTLNPQHAYRDNGTYTATLTVTDGRRTVRDTAVVTVANAAPVGVGGARPLCGARGPAGDADGRGERPEPGRYRGRLHLHLGLRRRRPAAQRAGPDGAEPRVRGARHVHGPGHRRRQGRRRRRRHDGRHRHRPRGPGPGRRGR